MSFYATYAIIGSSGGGGGGGVTSLNALTGAVTLAAGTGITIAPSGSTLTISSTSSSVAWGSITGTLSSQTDLQTALNAKAAISGQVFTGAISATNLSGTNSGDVTLGTADGLSLAGQVLSLALASTSATGALSSTDWNTFNGKQSSSLTTNHIFVGSAGSVATDVAMSGDVAIVASGATTIQSNVVSNGKLAQMATLTIKGNNTGGTANASDLTVAQVNAILPVFTSTLNGLAPLSGGGTANFLRADGTWTAPSGSGTVTTVSVVSANGFTGTVATATTTPAITLTTSITGVLKGNGTAISAATSGTDYSLGTSALATGILKSTSATGALTIAIASDFPTLNQNTTGTAANVTGVVALANGGTNANLTAANGAIPYSTGSALALLAPGTAGQILSSGGAGAPTWTTQTRSINSQIGTSYTFVLSDGSGAGGGPLVDAANASAQTYTVPANASVAFPVGTQIDVIQQGVGKVTFAAAGGVTINSLGGNLSIGGQYVGVSLIKIATNTWTLLGNLIA